MIHFIYILVYSLDTLLIFASSNFGFTIKTKMCSEKMPVLAYSLIEILIITGVYGNLSKRQ